MSSQPKRRRLELEQIGDVTVVNFVDKKILDEQSIQTIGDQLFGLVDQENCKKLLLNFSNVEFLSSAALGKLIKLNRLPLTFLRTIKHRIKQWPSSVRGTDQRNDDMPQRSVDKDRDRVLRIGSRTNHKSRCTTGNI